MREIKFRAIHKLTLKKWNEEDLYFHDGNWYEDFRALEDGRPLNLEQCEVMQYTGLKDENGTEIYEGDIVRHAADEGVYKVIFEDGGFYVKNLFEYDFQTINEYPLEVIGNIYENAELLKGEDR